MMNVRRYVAPLLLALSVGAALVPAVAAASAWNRHVLTMEEVNGIHPGELFDDVVKRLGEPDGFTTWPDGTRSAEYDVSDDAYGMQRIYVNLTSSNYVRSVQRIQR